MNSQRQHLLSQMFLRDLPEDLNTGRVLLKPLGRAARFITPCDACGEFSPKRLVSLCGHIFCFDCCVTRDTPEGLQLRCVVCNEKSLGDRGELTETFLKSLRFGCSCGHEGNLAELKEHIWNDDIDHRSPREEILTMPLERTSKSSFVASKDPNSQKTEPSVREKEGKELKKEQTETKDMFKEHKDTKLRDEVKELKDVKEFRELKEPRPKAFFCVELKTRIDEHRKTGTIQTAPGVSWQAAGYPVRFVCQIGAFNGKIFLGVFIQMLNDQPAFNTWPMKKRIIIELYNLKGEVVKTHRIITFANGKPVNEEFTIACNPTVGYGKPKFFNVEELLSRETELLCKGTACFAVEFQELFQDPC